MKRSIIAPHLMRRSRTSQPRKRTSHLKELYYIGAIVVIVVATIFSIWGRGGYLEFRRTQAELELQRVRVEALKKQNRQRLQNIEALRSDPRALERYAREKGYGRADEIIQQLPDQSGRK